MGKPIITILGSGNFRCSAPTLAAITTVETDPLQVRLFDPSPSRLEVADRMVRRFFEDMERQHQVISTTDIDESLENSGIIIYMLDEDAAYGMVATDSGDEEALYWIEESTTSRTPEDWEDGAEPQLRVVDLLMGDLNRPTPADRLSPEQLARTTRKVPEVSPEEAFQKAVEVTLRYTVPQARVLNLMSGVLLPEGIDNTLLLWPAPMDAQSQIHHVFRVLRWTLGEEEVRRYIVEQSESPVIRWLAGSDL